jgi:hypothetical protein
VQLKLAAAAALAVTLALGALAGDAAAYPQWQLSTGNTRCNLCHIAPAGGGLLNEYGRGEASDTISQFRGGSPDWMYGVYEEPDWMKLGVDLRVAGLVKDWGEDQDPRVHVFPMQGDTYSSFKWKAVSFYSVLGPRAQVRGPERSFLDRFGSREYWLMWRPKTVGWYARAGRFFAPYGLRMQDHTAYVRRYLGFNSWEETFNLSGGKVSDDWEAHATAFTRVPDGVQGGGPRHTGAAGYVEMRLGDDQNLAVGAQAKAGLGDDDRQYWAGGTGKYYLDAARLLFMGQLDLGYQDFTFGPAGRPQLAFYGGATWWPMQGIMAGAAWQRYDEDMSVRGLFRDAADLTLQYFPIGHLELMLLGRLEWQGDYAREPASLVMLQVHYYL